MTYDDRIMAMAGMYDYLKEILDESRKVVREDGDETRSKAWDIACNKVLYLVDNEVYKLTRTKNMLNLD